jgi:hypothetical protein
MHCQLLEERKESIQAPQTSIEKKKELCEEFLVCHVWMSDSEKARGHSSHRET